MLVIVLLIVLTIHRNHDYISDLAIWQDTVDKCPQNPRAWCDLGFALMQLHKMSEAEEQFEQALRINPNYADAHYNLGGALGRVGRPRYAIRHYEQALQVKPDLAPAQTALGRLQSHP